MSGIQSASAVSPRDFARPFSESSRQEIRAIGTSGPSGPPARDPAEARLRPLDDLLSLSAMQALGLDIRAILDAALSRLLGSDSSESARFLFRVGQFQGNQRLLEYFGNRFETPFQFAPLPSLPSQQSIGHSSQPDARSGAASGSEGGFRSTDASGSSAGDPGSATGLGETGEAGSGTGTETDGSSETGGSDGAGDSGGTGDSGGMGGTGGSGEESSDGGSDDPIGGLLDLLS